MKWLGLRLEVAGLWMNGACKRPRVCGEEAGPTLAVEDTQEPQGDAAQAKSQLPSPGCTVPHRAHRNRAERILNLRAGEWDCKFHQGAPTVGPACG